jgi:threonine synthase
MCDLGHEGIGAEPSSAATVAAFKKAVKDGKIKSTDVCTCIITGTAFKQPSVIEQAALKPRYSLRTDISEFRSLLQELKLL